MSAVVIGIIGGAVVLRILTAVAWVRRKQQPRSLAPLGAANQSGVGCPSCGGQTATPLRRVGWGGVLAPRLYRLVQCGACGSRFSANTGQHERELIGGYLRRVVAGSLLLAAGAAAAWWFLT